MYSLSESSKSEIDINEYDLYYILEMRSIHDFEEERDINIYIRTDSIGFEYYCYYTSTNKNIEEIKLSSIILEFEYNSELDKYVLDLNKSDIGILSTIVEEDYYDFSDEIWSMDFNREYNLVNDDDRKSLIFKTMKIIFYDRCELIDVLENLSNNIDYVSNSLLLQKYMFDNFTDGGDYLYISVNYKDDKYKCKSEFR